jgi:hypothetical protein
VKVGEGARVSDRRSGASRQTRKLRKGALTETERNESEIDERPRLAMVVRR